MKITSKIERAYNLGSAALLEGHQSLLFIFVDDNGADLWTNDRRQIVEGKIERSVRWLENKARERGIELCIRHVCLPFEPSVACHAGRSIDEADYCAGPGHATWQNHVVAGLTGLGSVSAGWDNLFKASGLPLNDKGGSAIIFCVRRWVPSVAFPFVDGQNAEFERERAIIYDNGGEGGQRFLDSLIAHEILHLYGAMDLAPDKADEALKEFASEHASDVMHAPTQQSIECYSIGDITAYLVGWLKAKPVEFGPS